MTIWRKLAFAVIVLLAIGAVGWFASDEFRNSVLMAMRVAHFAVHRTPPQCKKRADEFQTKVEVIQQGARTSLQVGAKKDDVARFFASENIPLTFDRIGSDSEATGTIYFKGITECENIACGDDSSLIGVRVKVDANGTVLSEPVVIGMYTDCL